MIKYASLFLLLLVAACKTGKENLPDVTTGLMVEIPFDGDCSEKISGTTGTSFHTLYGTNRKGEANKAIYFFRADSSYVDFGDLSGATLNENGFTVSCWVGVNDTTSVGAVMSKRGLTGPWEYSLDNHFSTGVFNLDNWDFGGGTSVYGIDPLKASAPIQPQVWQHLVYVANGSELRVYVNGVLQNGVDQRNAGIAFTNTDAHFVIGNGGGYNKNYHLDGAVDDVRIYNRALDEQAISYLYWH